MLFLFSYSWGDTVMPSSNRFSLRVFEVGISAFPVSALVLVDVGVEASVQTLGLVG